MQLERSTIKHANNENKIAQNADLWQDETGNKLVKS